MNFPTAHFNCEYPFGYEVFKLGYCVKYLQ